MNMTRRTFFVSTQIFDQDRFETPGSSAPTSPNSTERRGQIRTNSKYFCEKQLQALPGTFVSVRIVDCAMCGIVRSRIGKRMHRISIGVYLPVGARIGEFLRQWSRMGSQIVDPDATVQEQKREFLEQLIDREVLADNKFLPWLLSVIYPRSRSD